MRPKRTRVLPASLMVAGFLLLVLSAIALPSARASGRAAVIGFAVLSATVILAGVGLSMRRRRTSEDIRVEKP